MYKEKHNKQYAGNDVHPKGLRREITEYRNVGMDATKNVKTLSNNQLLFQTKTLVKKERQINVLVLQHLQEIEKRKLYLERGFSSLFDYAVKELGYSHSAAYRRIKAMRLCRDIPHVSSKIKTGHLNLTTASKLQTFFEKKKRKDNKLIKTTKPQEENNSEGVCSTSPTATECVKNDKNKPENKTQVGLNSIQKLDLIKRAENQSGRELEKTLFDIDPEVCNDRERVRDIDNNKVEIKIILDKDVQQKLESLKNLLSHKSPNMSYGELMTVLAELGLNKYDPKRRIKQSAKKPVSTSLKKTLGQKGKKKNTNGSKTTRYIPSVVRHHIWMRDQGQCAYVCPKTKRRCSSNHLLQIDHIQPFSLGGINKIDNLRLLCAGHNQYRNRLPVCMN